MNDKYTFEDWKNNKQVEPSEEGKRINDFYRGLVKVGRMEYEELYKIRDKQKWVYENAIEINKKALIASLKSELQRTDFPESYLEKEILKVNSELEEKSFIKERVLEGGDEYNNLSGDDLVEVEKVLNGERNNFYQIFCMTYDAGKWIPNEYIRVASLLHYQKFLKSFDLEAFLKQNEDQKETDEKRGRKRSKDLTVEMTKDFVREYKKEFKGRRDKFHDDGRVIKNRLYEYINDNVNIETEVVSRATIHRRIKEVLD